jgi:glycosyltransferase involved in cell wall biosynthesis
MKIVHFGGWGPSQSGMYESIKDQIKYERKEGLDSDFIDAVDPNGEGKEDGWLESINWRDALEADVWVQHALLPMPLVEYLEKVPANRKKHIIISVLHGPVEHMLVKEWLLLKKSDPAEGAFTTTHINEIWNWDACVVINQHEYDISVLYDENNKLIYIPNSIDLERLEDKYAWNYIHRPAIITCDSPRVEKLPAHILWSMPRIIKKIPGARLNIYGLPLLEIEFFRHLLCRSKNRILSMACCENVQMTTKTLVPFIKGADIGFNPNVSGILSRVGMEMMASGVPVVSYNGDYTKYHAKIFDLDSIAEQIERCWNDLNTTDLKNETIEYAQKNYDRAVHVKKYVELYQKLKEEKNG